MNDPIDFVTPENLSVHRAHRATNGFSVWDWWSFDTYLSWVIANGLKKFREEGHGYPADLTPEQWNILLDIMIEGFEAHQNKFNWNPDYKEEQAKVEVALDIFKAYFESLWD